MAVRILLDALPGIVEKMVQKGARRYLPAFQSSFLTWRESPISRWRRTRSRNHGARNSWRPYGRCRTAPGRRTQF